MVPKWRRRSFPMPNYTQWNNGPFDVAKVKKGARRLPLALYILLKDRLGADFDWDDMDHDFEFPLVGCMREVLAEEAAEAAA